jgi:HEAT repeat protein
MLLGLVGLGACKKHTADSPAPNATAVASSPRPPNSAELQAAPQQLASGDGSARLHALHVLVTSGAPEAVDPLLRALDAKSPSEQAIAVLGLGLLRDERALAPLLNLAETSKDQLVLAEVAWALGQFPPDKVTAPLIAIVRSTHSSYDRSSRQAGASLAHLGTAEANAAVFDRSDSPSMPVLGQLPQSVLEADALPDPQLAQRLALRPECDAIDAILRWSRVPPPEGARGLYVSADVLEDLPEGCGEALRRSVKRWGGADAKLLASRATLADVALLQQLAGKSNQRVRYAPAETLHSLGFPLQVEAVSEAAAPLASPLDPAWPNALWRDGLRPRPKDERARDPLDDVGIRAFAPLLRQLTGGGGTARYELDAKLPQEQLLNLALGRHPGSRKPDGERGFITLLGLATPRGPELLGKVLEQTASADAVSHWLDSSVTLALFELETATVVALSRSPAPTLRAQAISALTWRDDPAAQERIRQAITEADPVAQRAAVTANVFLKSVRPIADFAALLDSSEPSVVKAVIEGIVANGTPSDAKALDLVAREATLAARTDLVSVLAPVEPDRAEQRLLSALGDNDLGKREQAAKWLTYRHYPAAGKLESRLVLRAITDESLGPARGALLHAVDKLAGQDVWELLHRPEADATRRAFLAALERSEPELQLATAVALARVIETYPPDAALRELMVKHASRIIARLRKKAPDDSFGEEELVQVLARGLVVWLGNEPTLGPQLARRLFEADRPAELHALLRLQPSKSLVEPLLDRLPKLNESDAMIAAFAPVLSTELLPLALARLAKPDSPLRTLVYSLIDERRVTASIAANPALHEPLRTLIGATPAADDYPGRKLRTLALTIASRARDPFYAPLLGDTATGKPPLGALFDHDWKPSELADLLVTRREPELSALLPRLQHAPEGTLDWLRAAEARQVRLPARSVLPALGSVERDVPREAARQLAHAHETEHWLQVLAILCDNESPAQVMLDTLHYSVDELAQASRAEKADTRACALSVMGRRAPGELGPRLLEAMRDASPLVRQTALQLATLHPQPELGARALELLEAGISPALRPWALAAWLVNNRGAAPRFLGLGPLLRGSLKLPRVFAADFDECSYFLPLAAVHDEVARAQYESFAYDRGNPGADKSCAFPIWLPLAWSGADFVAHYERAPRADRELMLEALLNSKLPLDASYAAVLERVTPDVLRFDGPAYTQLPHLLDRLLELPKPTLLPLLEQLSRDASLDAKSHRLIERAQALL